MEIRIDSVASTPSSLRFGCVITGPQGSWVKFAQIVVDDETFSIADAEEIMGWFARQVNRYLDSERDEATQEDAPLF